MEPLYKKRTVAQLDLNLGFFVFAVRQGATSSRASPEAPLKEQDGDSQETWCFDERLLFGHRQTPVCCRDCKKETPTSSERKTLKCPRGARAR